MSRLSVRLSTALGLVSTVVVAVLTVGVTACGARPAYDGPELSAQELQQHDRCVALLRSAWQGAPVRYTSAERGAHGLDYVWVNVDVDDDRDDIERRSAKGTSHAGHCQFDHTADTVHVHSYVLDASPAASAAHTQPTYRFFTASANEHQVASSQPASPSH